MATDEQYEALLRQIAALTERVYKLEQLAGIRREQAASPPSRSYTVPADSAPAEATGALRPDAQDELESQIGGYWLNRVGIVAVLIGVSYFLKYAFDNEWVGPAGRVVIGLTAGLGVVVWSEHVRKSGYAIFSFSLKAVGIGVLYLSLWASSQLYDLVPVVLAFIAMTSVTAATVALALWQNAQVIAAFAAIGGFLTPVALSTGQNNALSLFSYLMILDVGALILVRYRPWIRVLIGAYLGTLILYSAWHNQFFSLDQFAIALGASSLLFVIFAVAPFIDSYTRDTNGILFLALANAATYFFQVWELFDHAEWNRQAAIASVLFGCLYFLLARLLTSRAPAVTAEVHGTIGAALLVVAVPLGLDTPWITIGWFVEAAALIAVSFKTENKFLKYLGAIALVLGIIRLLAIDNFAIARFLFNERMMTFAVAIASLGYVARLLALDQEVDDRSAAAALVVAINVLALVGGTREITDAFRGVIRDFAYSAFWMSYGASLMFVGFWKKSRFLRWQALILIALTICKVFLYDISSLDRGYRILSLIALGLILLVTSFLYQRDWFKLDER
jgi:uncharacterized membrane protein